MNTLSPEHERRLGNLNTLGLVTHVNPEDGTCRVQTGDNHTDWIAFRSARMGATKIWLPPSVGEQVEITSRNGELEASHVGSSLPTDDNPIPANPQHAQIHMPDGAEFRYDHEASILHINLPSTATLNLIGGNLNLTGSGVVTIGGQTINLNGALNINGKPFLQHNHLNVQGGMGVSGGVQP